MIFEEDIEKYRTIIRNIYNKLLRENNLTGATRYKLQGADMILSTILRKQNIEHFIRLANLKGKRKWQNITQLKQ